MDRMSKPSLWLVLTLGALTAFGPLTVDMYLPSLPGMARDLNASTSSVELTLSVFFAGMAIGQAFYGPLSDRFGRRGPLFLGIVVYVLASIGCALTPDINTLIALRFLQALGGCAGTVIARAVARDITEGVETARLLSTLIMIMGVAPILAPSLGGYLLLYVSWRAIFWILTGFGLFCLLAVIFVLPETRPPERRPTGGIVSVLRVYGRLLSTRRFVGFMAMSGFSLSGMFAYITASPHLFIDGYHLNPQQFAILFGTNALGFIAVSQINRVLLPRFGLASTLATAILVYAAASLLLLIVALAGGPLWALLPPLFMAIASLGAVVPNASAAALSGEPVHAGSASALLGTAAFVGGTFSGSAVAAVHADSALLPMTVIMAVCAVIALAAHRLLVGRT
jgi:MFS transporter, DHA1 family, multidrug resistance protein